MDWPKSLIYYSNLIYIIQVSFIFSMWDLLSNINRYTKHSTISHYQIIMSEWNVSMEIGYWNPIIMSEWNVSMEILFRHFSSPRWRASTAMLAWQNIAKIQMHDCYSLVLDRLLVEEFGIQENYKPDWRRYTMRSEMEEQLHIKVKNLLKSIFWYNIFGIKI